MRKPMVVVGIAALVASLAAGCSPAPTGTTDAPASAAASSASKAGKQGKTPKATTGSATVAVAPPTRIRIPETGFDSRTRTMAIASTGVIDPPGFADVYWISDRGSAPGSDAQDTTYFSCHTDHNASPVAVRCNALPGAVQAGQHVVVSNANGDITYRIVSVREVRRADFASDESWNVTPGRLVLVTCYLENHQRTDFNLVIEADAA